MCKRGCKSFAELCLEALQRQATTEWCQRSNDSPSLGKDSLHAHARDSALSV